VFTDGIPGKQDGNAHDQHKNLCFIKLHYDLFLIWEAAPDRIRRGTTDCSVKSATPSAPSRA
jgi:hypothetical protein